MFRKTLNSFDVRCIHNFLGYKKHMVAHTNESLVSCRACELVAYVWTHGQ